MRLRGQAKGAVLRHHCCPFRQGTLASFIEVLQPLGHFAPECLRQRQRIAVQLQRHGVDHRDCDVVDAECERQRQGREDVRSVKNTQRKLVANVRPGDFTSNFDFETLALSIHGSTEFAFGDKQISFKGPFRRVPMPDAVKEATGIDFLAIKTDEEARAAAKAAGFEVEKDATWGECLAFIFEEKVEQTLIQPAHVTHFPKDISPFAKEVPGEPRLVERFETYCNTWELGNAFSELNDPEDQAARFRAQVEAKEGGDDEAMHFDADYIRALEVGLAPTGGLGVGIDRLVMLLTGSSSIRDVLLFPYMRPGG